MEVIFKVTVVTDITVNGMDYMDLVRACAFGGCENWGKDTDAIPDAVPSIERLAINYQPIAHDF